jgi:hypothetical protein
MKSCRRSALLCAVLLSELALLALTSQATTFARLQLADLAQQAGAVARLRWISEVSLWEHGEIWTDTRFEVLAAEKGTLPRFVKVRTPGGRVNGIASHVEGAPRFQPGEEVYLFLWSPAGEPYRVLGWAQGTFRIRRDPSTKRERVTQDSSAIPVFDPQRREFRVEGVRNLALPEFLARLRSAITESR